jgi:hypothetical protein
MNHLETLLAWSTMAFEAAVCGFVFARRAQRELPFFAAYTAVLFANSIGIWIVYRAFGFDSQMAYYWYWIALLLNAVARSLAIAELCWYKLHDYRGIWELVWRLLICVSMLFLFHAAFDTWGQPNRLAIYSLTLDRDLDIASVGILGVLLLIHNYYGLSLKPLQRTIAAGICFICAVDVIVDSTVQKLFTGYLFPLFAANRTPLWASLEPEIARVKDLFGTIHLLCFMAAMGIWCYALRRPLPAPSEGPTMLPAEVYREMSPAINMRLATFNNRLVELLKP